MARRKSITTKQIRADHWEPHEAVVIRSLNTDDEEQINDQMADVDAAGKVALHSGRNKRLTLQRGIVSWTLTDEHGNPLPLNEQSIRGLAQEDSTHILNEINALNTPLTDAEKKGSSTSATPGIEEKAQPFHKPA